MINQNFLSNYYKALHDFNNKLNCGSYIILLYHGVTKSKSFGVENYSKKHVPINAFYKQISWLKKNCNILSLDEIIHLNKLKKAPPPRSVVISFDDGFKNNLYDAAPILNEFKAPAVFYISTGFIETNRLFWVDQIEDCINRSQSTQITLTFHNQPKNFELSRDEQKIECVNEIKFYCKAVPAIEKDRLLQELSNQTQIVPSRNSCSNYEMMNWNEINELNSNPLFTIGAHSHSHEILSYIPESQMKDEIETSLKILSEKLKQPILHFSYPEGQENHYNGVVIQTLKENGVICSPSAISGLNQIEDDLFHLKRVMVNILDLPFPFWDSRLQS